MPTADSIAFLIGVDGGGSGTRALLADRNGNVLGRGQAGPSALGQGIESAWVQLRLAVQAAFADARVVLPEWRRCALGAGLSGATIQSWRDEFLARNIGFAHLVLESDCFTMLLGAHGGRPGAIVASGTGSVGEALRADGTRRMVGGWGFPHGDEGSGAWLGQRAVQLAQSAIDGRAPAGDLVRQVWAVCGSDRAALQAWCGQAGQFAFAQLAPKVFACADSDPSAARLLDEAVAALNTLALALDPPGELPLAMCGSVGQRLSGRLSPELRSRYVEAAGDSASGALTLLRRSMETPIP
ncbi:MAG: ATPase [Proteobacteria bacterium]|nr:ATPase [Pseudomonadota bacterium]